LIEKHRNYLDSIFYGFAGQQLKFESTDKNRELRTEKEGSVFDEDANFIIGNTNQLFKPIVFEIEPQASTAIVDLMEQNPNRCFSFIHPNGLTYAGFNLKMGIAANSLEEQAFQLLAIANQDLKTLKTWQR